jgi:phage baseplate assembly protein W
MIPHFAIPFRIDPQRGAYVTEQGSEQEIMDCVEVVMRYNPGDRPEKLTFGIPDETFKEEVDVVSIANAVSEWEPRVELSVESQINLLDPLITKVRVMRERD